ncbi:MAG TPA: hypothetical protein VNB49_16980, partial [Candidatus Dormibacteraeota bacterium]|nr:hypothetical protein [Candidatus Dormibacteraeota bacterium]
ALIPVRLDQADVLIDGSVGALDFGGAEVHLVTLFLKAITAQISARIKQNVKVSIIKCAPMKNQRSKAKC